MVLKMVNNRISAYLDFIQFEVSTAVTTKNAVFWECDAVWFL
jgi:hypothetical protein